MFEWVKVWFDVCISERNLVKTTIRSRPVAKNRLEQIREESTQGLKEFERMQSVFERLWDLNSTVDSEDLGTMTRLFEFILAALIPLDLKLLSTALRIQKDTYDEYPSSEDVSHLCSNFLDFREASWIPTDPHLRKLKFRHSTAMRFVKNKICPRNEHVDESEEVWEARLAEQTNMSMVRLFLDVMSSKQHEFLKAPDIELHDWPLKTTEYLLNASLNTRVMESDDGPLEARENKLLYAISRIPPDDRQLRCLKYVATYGLQHVALVAKERSFRDPLWRKVIDSVILNPESALRATFNVGFWPVLRHQRKDHLLANLSVFAVEDESKLLLLPSHLLVLLDLMQEKDLDILTGDTVYTGQVPDKLSLPKDRAQMIMSSLQRDIQPQQVIKGLDFTALQLACWLGNTTAVATLLNFLKVHAPEHLEHQLAGAGSLYNPLAMAIAANDYEVAKILLHADKIMSESASHGSQAPRKYAVSKQWMWTEGRPETAPLFHRAVKTFGIKELRHVLDVARPEDVNVRDNHGRTALHIAMRDVDQASVKMLIEEFHVDPNMQDHEGQSPAFLAYMWNKETILDYLHSLQVCTDFPDFEKGAWEREAQRQRTVQQRDLIVVPGLGYHS